MDSADRIFPQFGRVRLIQGRARVLAWAPALEELADRCGQPGACHWLDFFLSGASARHKHPLLVLEAHPGLDPAALQPGAASAAQLRSAVLLSEYRPFGLRTRIVTGEDEAGWRSVIAPPEDRRQAALHALEAALASGALLAVSTFEPAPHTGAADALPLDLPVRYAVRERPVAMRLPLAETLEATLARMSRKTRLNMRAFRRKLETAHELEFVPDALKAITGPELLEFQRRSRYPCPDAEFCRRIAACAGPDSYLAGLRVRGGPWLSFAGGWRQGSVSVLYLQLNASGWEKASLSMVMRSFLIEHEIACGAAELQFYGGTPHPIQQAFLNATVEDLLLRRRGLSAGLLAATLPLLRSRFSPVGRSNFLAGMLSDPRVRWYSGSPRKATAPGRSQRAAHVTRLSSSASPRP